MARTSGTAELSGTVGVQKCFALVDDDHAGRENGQRKLGFWINRKVAYLDERWSWPALLPFASPRFMSALATMCVPRTCSRAADRSLPICVIHRGTP